MHAYADMPDTERDCIAGDDSQTPVALLKRAFRASVCGAAHIEIDPAAETWRTTRSERIRWKLWSVPDKRREVCRGVSAPASHVNVGGPCHGTGVSTGALSTSSVEKADVTKTTFSSLQSPILLNQPWSDPTPRGLVTANAGQ